jgi:hypothetical protein
MEFARGSETRQDQPLFEAGLLRGATSGTFGDRPIRQSWRLRGARHVRSRTGATTPVLAAGCLHETNAIPETRAGGSMRQAARNFGVRGPC